MSHIAPLNKQRKTLRYIKNIIYIFILQRWRLCVCMNTVRTCLSSVAGTLFVKSCGGRRTHTRSWQVCLSDQRVSPFAWETRRPLPFVWETSRPLPFAWETSRPLPFVWETSRPLPFAWETSRPLPFLWATARSLPSVQNYRLYIVFSSPMRKYEHLLCLTYWLVIGTYMLPVFFSVISWSYQWTEISVTLSIGNKSYSLSCETTLCDIYYLATALNLLSPSSPAKLVYYIYCSENSVNIQSLLENLLDYELCTEAVFFRIISVTKNKIAHVYIRSVLIFNCCVTIFLLPFSIL